MPEKKKTLSSNQLSIKNAERLQTSQYIAYSGPFLSWLFYFIYSSSSSNLSFYLNLFGTIINVLSHRWLVATARANLTDLESCEITSDLMITTTVCLIVGIFTTWIWLLWLWLPIYLFCKLWVSVIWPWFTEPRGDEVEMTDKQRKKMEKKQKQKVKFRSY